MSKNENLIVYTKKLFTILGQKSYLATIIIPNLGCYLGYIVTVNIYNSQIYLTLYNNVKSKDNFNEYNTEKIEIIRL